MNELNAHFTDKQTNVHSGLVFNKVRRRTNDEQ